MAKFHHAREFRNASGTQTLEAEFVRYNVKTGNVTLRTGVGRNMVVPADKFSKEDVAYFLDQQKIEDQKDAISVNVKADNDRENETRGLILYKLKKSRMVFNVANSSDFPFSDLKMDYWVIVERDNKGKGKVEILNGSADVAAVDAKGNAEIEGPSLDFTQGAVSVCTTGCPKVAARASLGRDRPIGTKVEVYNAAGELIYSDCSSMRVENMLAGSE